MGGLAELNSANRKLLFANIKKDDENYEKYLIFGIVFFHPNKRNSLV
tara:strand:+ start:639 stop:779 length:141 start_codon:yes stop_codon:yes gene_type:complete